MIIDREHKFDSFGETYANVSISSTEGSDIDFVIYYLYEKWENDEDWTDISDSDSLNLKGKYNSDGTLSFDPETEGLAFTVHGFYSNGYKQYAVGTMVMQSGEPIDVFLVRP